MAWNRSSSQKTGRRRGGATTGAPSLRWLRVTIIVFVLALAGGVALWCWAVRSGDEGPNAQDSRRGGLIAEATPAAAAKADMPKAGPAGSALGAERMWYDADTNSAAYKIYHHRGPIVTNSFAVQTQSLAARTFRNTSDKIIGQLLSVKPGAALFGDVKYDQRFVRRFLESLKTPIVVDSGDSEQVKVLKEAVIEARKELKAAYDRGEDVAQIMTETRRELKELGAYRAELQRQVNDIIRKDARRFSAQDMEDCLNAANKMLSDRGCQPLVMPGLMRHRLKVLHSQGIQEVEE